MSTYHDTIDKLPGDSATGLLTGLEKEHHDQHERSWRETSSFTKIIPWLLCCVLATSTAVLALLAARPKNCVPYWHPTEFIGAKNEIEPAVQRVRMTAGINYDDDLKAYRLPHPEIQDYLAEPGPEVDAAWDALVGTIDVFVTPEEAKTLNIPNMFLDPETSLYSATPVAAHDIHCLNMLRKNLHVYWDYYGEHEYHHRNTQSHLEHCIDALRQSLMCTGEMTIFPTIFDERTPLMVPDFEAERTCRDYKSLQEWARKRDASDPDRWRQNADRINAEIKG